MLLKTIYLNSYFSDSIHKVIFCQIKTPNIPLYNLQLKNQMKKIILLLISSFIGLASVTQAQTEIVIFDCSFKVWEQDLQQTLPKIKIEVYENGNLIKKLTTDRDGKAYQNFELNREYDIKINPEGGKYIQKWVKLDTRNIDLHAWKFKNRKEFRYYYQIEINLFEPERCEQFAFLHQQPIINFKYNTKKRDLMDVADNRLTKRINKERKKKCIASF